MRYFYCSDQHNHAAIIMAKSKKECFKLFKGEFKKSVCKKLFMETMSFQQLLMMLTADKENDEHLNFGEARDLLEDNMSKIIAVY